jgi:hypothetical protein
MKKPNMRQRCQEIWIRAMGDSKPIVLRFSDTTMMHKARLALYDSIRKSRNSQLKQAKELIEIRMSSKDMTLTIEQKANNPFFGELDKQLDIVLEDKKPPLIDLTQTANAPPEIDISESLRKFQEKVCKESRPSNPYFKREG